MANWSQEGLLVICRSRPESTSISQTLRKPARADINRILLLSADHEDPPKSASSDKRRGSPPSAGMVQRVSRARGPRLNAIRLPSKDHVALESFSPGPG